MELRLNYYLLQVECTKDTFLYFFFKKSDLLSFIQQIKERISTALCRQGYILFPLGLFQFFCLTMEVKQSFPALGPF